METKAERRARLTPYLDKYANCPTTNGKDLDLWEEMKEQQERIRRQRGQHSDCPGCVNCGRGQSNR